MAVNEAGEAVVIWHGDQSGPWALYGQRYDAFGQRVGEEFRVHEGHVAGSSADFVAISVAMDRAGRFVVTWHGEDWDGDSYGVEARLLAPMANLSGHRSKSMKSRRVLKCTPAVAMQPDGSFVIVWNTHGYSSEGVAIAGQRFAADGSRIGHEFLVTSSLTNNPDSPDVAMDADGNFTVTWNDQGGSDGSGSGIYACRFGAAAEPQGTAFRVNSTTNDEQRYPRIAMDSDGDFVIGWSSYNQDGGDYGAYAQRFMADGTAQGAEFRVNATTAGKQYLQGVASDTRGDFIITWTSGPADGSNYDVYAQRYDRFGQLIGSEFLVNSTTAGNQDSAHVGMSGSGDFLVAWNGSGVGDSEGIFAPILVRGSCLG